MSGGTAQTFTEGCTGATAGTGAQGLITCTFTGNDSIGSYAQSAGSFSGTCSTSGRSATVNGVYTRVLTHMTASGTASGAISGTFSGVCVWAPTSYFLTIPPGIVGTTIHCNFTVT